MAFVFKSPNSKYWIAGFRDLTGKRKNRSTKLLAKEQNKRRAEALADQFEAAANRRRTARQVQRTISELHKELTGEDLPSCTVESFVSEWLSEKKPTVKPATYEFYVGATAKFLGFLDERRATSLAEVTHEDIKGFRDTMVERLAPKTTNHNLKVLRMLFRDARSRSFLLDDPTEFVKCVKNQRAVERRPFTLEEVQRILAHCDDEWRSMVLFGLYTGQRIGDIARMRWEAIDRKDAVIRVRTSKTGKFLRIPLHAALVEHLDSLPQPISRDVPIHPRIAETVARHGRTGGISNEFARILANAGIRPKRPHRALGDGRDGRRQLHELSFHCLRGTATTLLHEAGVAPAVAMAIIGHDSEEIHRIYVSVGEEALRAATEKLPKLA